MQSLRLWTILWTAIVMSRASVAALPLITNTTEPRILTHEDAIVYGRDGHLQVIRKAELALIQNELLGVNAPTPLAILPEDMDFLAEKSQMVYTHAKNALARRHCTESIVFSVGNATKFFGQDILMSSVVRSPNETVSQVTINSGHQLSNSINPGAGGSVQLIEKFLGAKFHIDYLISWTTSHSASYLFQIPAGMIGGVVSNPTTTRHVGFYDTGCIAEAKRIPFYSDVYSSKSYNSLNWVDGVITLCLGRTWPLHRCVGDGHLT